MWMRLTLLPLVLATAGCGALSALDDAARPLEIYELRTPGIETAARRRNVELVVEEPIASGALSTERIMIRPARLQAQYLPDVRWADPAPVMLRTLLLRSLAETGAFTSVGRQPLASSGDYALLGELTDFQAEPVVGSETAEVRVRLMLRLVRERDASVVASRTFDAVEQSADTGPDSLVAAFDRATAALIAEVLPWVIAET